MVFDIALTLFFVFLNGFFVAAEFAIVKVRASQLDLRIREGVKMATLSRNIVEHLDAYLSATQLGITLASLGLGWIGDALFEELIHGLLTSLSIEIEQGLLEKISFVVAFLSITFLHIVFGELAPKSMAIQRPEAVTMFVSLPLKAFYVVFKPFIRFLNWVAGKIISAMGFAPMGEEHELHTEDEIRLLVKESTESGLIEGSEHELIENVFNFGDTSVRTIMVPRQKITAIELGMEQHDIIELIMEEGYSRLPVYDKTIDNIIGVIYAKDIINLLLHDNLIIPTDLIRPAYSIKEDMMLTDVLNELRTRKVHMAIVQDEFGGTSGLVTLEDILEEIIGEIQDEYDEETPLVEKRHEDTYIVIASAAIDEANRYLPVELPEAADEEYETVGGMVIRELGTIPQKGEEIFKAGYSIKVLKRNDRGIETLMLKLIEEEKSDEEASDE
ncbi:MAG: hemolysin family protein [Candidatus Kapaibacteriales bacterium]